MNSTVEDQDTLAAGWASLERELLRTPSLNTPTVCMDGPRWGREPSVALTSGLFNTLDGMNTNGSPHFGPYTTSEPTLDCEDMSLSALDPRDVDRLLEQMTSHTAPMFAASSHACVEPETLVAETDQQPDSYLLDAPRSDWTADQVLHGLSHDHAYLDKDALILSEFLDMTAAYKISADDPVVEATMMSADALLQPEPTFMDTYTDLFEYLSEEDNDRAESSQSSFDVNNDNTGDERYRQRRISNNRASRVSRQTRKNRRVEMEAERTELELKNTQLKAEIERLESLAQEWKGRLLQVLSNK